MSLSLARIPEKEALSGKEETVAEVGGHLPCSPACCSARCGAVGFLEFKDTCSRLTLDVLNVMLC